MRVKRKRRSLSRKKKWIPKDIKKGALKRQLGYKEGQKIPSSVLDKILKAKVGSKVIVNGKSIKVTAKLKRRVSLARTLGRLRKRGRKKK